MKLEQVVPILTSRTSKRASPGSASWAGSQWRGKEGGPVDFGAVVAGDLEIFLCRDGQGGCGHVCRISRSTI